jgi:hypothetical protein
VNGFEFVASIVGSLAWPVAFVIAGLVFRDDLRSLFNSINLKRLKLGSFETEFDVAADLDQSITTAEADIRKGISDGSISDEPPNPKLIALMEIDPGLAIIDAWRSLEEDISRVSSEKFGNPKNWPARRHIVDLIKRNEIEEEVGAALLELNHSRNQIVHNRNYKVDRARSFRFLDIAADAAKILSRIMVV